MRRHRVALGMMAMLWLVGGNSAPGQTQTCAVTCGSGHMASNGTLTSVSVGGQSGGYAWASGGVLQHFGGFLGATLNLNLDTDGDGLIDELDADNDNDDLSDVDEVSGQTWSPSGVTSDPNTADSDGDGMTDWQESIAGTHPTNAAQRLEILSVALEPASNGVALVWLARDGMTYRLWRVDDLVSPAEQSMIGSVQANDPSAVSPWFETTAQLVDSGVLSSNSPMYFYYVDIEP